MSGQRSTRPRPPTLPTHLRMEVVDWLQELAVWSDDSDSNLENGYEVAAAFEEAATELDDA